MLSVGVDIYVNEVISGLSTCFQNNKYCFRSVTDVACRELYAYQYVSRYQEFQDLVLDRQSFHLRGRAYPISATYNPQPQPLPVTAA